MLITKVSSISGVVRVRLLERQPDHWRPQWYLFFSCSGTCSQQVQRRALVGVQGAKSLEAPKNLHLTLGLELTKITGGGYAFFSCALQYKATGKFQKVQNFEFSSFLSETKCVCFIFTVTDQC